VKQADVEQKQEKGNGKNAARKTGQQRKKTGEQGDKTAPKKGSMQIEVV
jgi:hypothetical protein